ncbi:LacI family DNA-binding transcriptional regulator [Variovorax sp. J22R133]|uniref:LacI family DNA-binding transcriptional regulator n=1 Tax=Variovorax brevis TaxID=3053503 RepID=UPI0025787F12|nr:LacI family DNA-binding transcriptional regulator [Variovorax sp. J22R133]MDM0116419.1 LacI family DNA-binding transcriptional regulator [Variovorax sp. J22R133]
MVGSNGKLTSRDVARLAGVSQATVSRVLQNSPLVQPATRQAVLDAIAQSGYAPNAAARWMRTRRTDIIALVVANLAVNPLYPAMLQLLSTALRKRGMSASVYEEEDFSESTLRRIVEGGVDGVITTTAMEASVPFLERIAEQVPLILLHRTVSSKAFDQFSSDNHASGAAVASFFAKHGRKKIGLISGYNLPSTLREREQGFTAELARRGLQLKEYAIARVPKFSYAAGAEAAREIMKVHGVNAIFGVNDIVAIGALDGLRSKGLAVPDDVWVVGHDDVPMAAWDCINLTTVAQSREAMVDAAVARLCARLDNQDLRPKRVVLPYEFIRRGTAG